MDGRLLKTIYMRDPSHRLAATGYVQLGRYVY